VTPGAFYATYDFGWGRAYLFPGEVDLIMFLNDGRALGFNSISPILTSPETGQPVCSGLFQNVTGTFQPIADWINKLACFVYSLFGNVIGTISTIFQVIWNGIKQLGEWVYNALVGIFNTIVKIVTDIVDIAEQVVFSLMTVIPFMVVSFIGGKGFPDMSDARRAVRKIRATARDIRGRGETARATQRRVRLAYHEARTRRLNAKFRREGGK
jgi:hypothetical protein